ncbi:DoxX family protein [Lacihabitans sp. CCS-44]|uniref:DoxX family protein n=1 Tax=Lacihabitans sp. CCS-44 TaxID=2487331 RepID=UPI0020CDA367|nr:DoxX family protein [Lacihabitans sp. CCS-44]MCP9756067.1 DoxX family protein [Lacihabitans sp. CCS-44]
MKKTQKSSKVLNITLWFAQGLLAASLVWGASMKLFQPIEKLAIMWPWVSQISERLVKFTGVIDLLGGIGVIAPTLFKIKPKLTVITAWAIVLLMICASVFHILRGELSLIGANIVFALMAGFVAWGRAKF